MSTKAQLNAAFRELRKMGFEAKQNFSCCSGCAGYEAATKLEEAIDADPSKKDTYKGFIFYHKQDASGMRQCGKVHIRFGSLGTQKYGNVGMDTTEIGYIVYKCLVRHGVHAEWSGNPDSCIEASGFPFERSRRGRRW